ncbi:ANK [Seminavis robusta]|uniref:ANK n=1 Tax=Seminavis robusta TaxID=568900 RepID=A0A9N8E3S3_9STRA|nr:ANK [Seminavis robusta]|eukprot:Sro629_g178200.1 ANK (465) ;mRNA; f:35355-36749
MTTTGEDLVVSSHTKKEKRLSRVHGWAKVRQLVFSDSQAPWDRNSNKALLVESSDDDDEDDDIDSAYYSQESYWTSDDDDDESINEEDELSLAAMAAQLRDQLQEDSLLNDNSPRSSFVKSLREANCYSPTVSQAFPSDISLSTVDDTSEIGFSYHSRSYHSRSGRSSRRHSISRTSLGLGLEDPITEEGEQQVIMELSSDIQTAEIIMKEEEEEIESVPHPKDTLMELLQDTKFQMETLTEDYWKDFFLPITPYRIDSFKSRVARLVSKGNAQGLKEYHHQQQEQQQQQQSTAIEWNACNARGEFYLLLACRAQSRNTAKYLLQQGASVQVQDKFGRSPLVELCWTNKPDFGLLTVVIQRAPALLFVPDRRGFSPLRYIPKECHKEWNAFLQSEPIGSRIVLFARYAVYCQTASELQRNQQRLQTLLRQRVSCSTSRNTNTDNNQLTLQEPQQQQRVVCNHAC